MGAVPRIRAYKMCQQINILLIGGNIRTPWLFCTECQILIHSIALQNFGVDTDEVLLRYYEELTLKLCISKYSYHTLKFCKFCIISYHRYIINWISFEFCNFNYNF